MKAWFLLTVLAIALAGCATGATELPAGEKIIVNKQTWTTYRDYLSKIGPGIPGVFAIDKKGEAWGWSRCPSLRCNSKLGLANEALDGCRASSEGVLCIIFARDADIVVPYEIAQ